MACEAVHMWSLSGLIAAFLDLAIAYLLLCASAAAYLASKFLGFFGLNLPCPCDGMFINIQSKGLCFNSLLIDFPTQKVLDVQLSVKQKFPFGDPICLRKYDCCIDGNNCVNGILELESEASCSSVSDARRPMDMVPRSISSKIGKYDVKGKGVRSRLRHRKGVGDHGKNSLLPCYDPPLSEEVLVGDHYSHFSTSKKGNALIKDDNTAPKPMKGRHRALTSVEMNEPPNEDISIKRSIQSIEELQNTEQGVQRLGGDEKNIIRLLEQKLEEERAARTALYIELEKERSAAATAADEAMAMILRLQEEKASIEMEARQYQRIIEEKSAYDAEEMNILKEILVRREKEKHFLEKEVEAYRQMVSDGNEQLADDGSDAGQIFGPLFDPNDDPVLILHQLNASTDKKVSTENELSGGPVVMEKLYYKPAFETESPIQCHNEQYVFEKHRDSNEICGNMDLQEKEIVIADGNMQLTSKAPLECQKTTPLHGKELEQVQEMNHKLIEKIIETCSGTENDNPTYDQSLKQQEKDGLIEFGSSSDPVLDKDPHVYDVHIIGDGINIGSHLETEADVRRSVSEVTCGLPPIGPRGLSLLSDPRRSSSSAMDSEMLKIGSEIGRLRERLKLVQEGREKLGLSLENQERENVQLKLLEDIARQVQEIRRLTEPGKASRQVSLPLTTSKVLSKKRRSRSVSSGLQLSSEG